MPHYNHLFDTYTPTIYDLKNAMYVCNQTAINFMSFPGAKGNLFFELGPIENLTSEFSSNRRRLADDAGEIRWFHFLNCIHMTNSELRETRIKTVRDREITRLARVNSALRLTGLLLEGERLGVQPRCDNLRIFASDHTVLANGTPWEVADQLTTPGFV